MRRVLDLVLTLLFYSVFIWVILSWIPTTSGHPLGRLQAFLDRIIGPLVGPIRKVVPPIRIGGGALDLSPLILLIGLQILMRVI